MKTIVLNLCWVDAAVWLVVFGYYMLRVRQPQWSGIRPLEKAFAGVSLILVLHAVYCALLYTSCMGLIPSVDRKLLVQPLLGLIYHLLLIVLGGMILFYLSRRFARLQQELALAGLYARYRYMIEGDPRAILLFQADGKLVEINRIGRLWMGATNLELQGCSMLGVLRRLEQEHPEYLMRRILNREMIEIRVGERIWSEFEFSQLEDEQGCPAGSMLCARDVTEDKKFQREIIQSEKLAVVGQLAAATAHEIRNPLTSIKGFLQLMEQRLPGNEHEHEIKDYTRIMVEEVDRMEKIIRDFLLMTKPSDVTRENACLNAVIERMLVLVQNQATLRNIHVETDLVPLPEVQMHKEAIQQVVLNLLQNAFEAMNIGGTLTIRTFEDVRYVAVVVHDTGVGMTEEEIANLGSPFYSTKTEGTGLGLTVSSKIIREHGGRLEVESTKGVGTSITIKLPK